MTRRRMLHSFFSCLVLTGLLILSLRLTLPARADIAPPAFPPGSNLQPGAINTNVRMVSEVVTLSVIKESGIYRFPDRLEASKVGQARINAVFIMRNMGQAAELMEVRFPLTSLRGDGWLGFPEIFDLSVKVNGGRVETHRIEKTGPGETPESYAGPWAAFPVSFPADRDVKIELNYTDYGATESPITRFGYILETGAGWSGTIGSADIILRLPYPASSMNILVDESTSGGTIAGSEMRWHYDDLEPTSDNNMDFAIILPEVWNRVVIENQNVTKNPRDGEAWGRLGKAYKETLFEHGRARCWQENMPDAYQKSYDAYEQAVQFLPKDGLWHYGFADLIWINIGFCNKYGGTSLGEDEKQQFGEQLRQALSLIPSNQDLQFLDQEVKNGMPDFYHRYVLQLPTPTPMVTQTTLPSPIPLPTASLAPTVTSAPLPSPSATAVDVVVVEDTAVPTVAPTPTAKPAGGTTLCPGAAVLPVLMAAFLIIRRRVI